MWSLQVLLILRKKEYIPLIGTCGCSQSSMHLILTAVSHQEEAQLLYSHVRGLNRELSIFRSLHNNHIYYGKKQTNPKHTTIITEHLLCPSPFARKGRLHKLCPQILLSSQGRQHFCYHFICNENVFFMSMRYPTPYFCSLETESYVI